MGYRREESKALSADGKEIPGAVVTVDEQANYGHYDELAALAGIPFRFVAVHVQEQLTVVTSLSRTARNGNTLKLYMRPTIPLYEWNWGAIQASEIEDAKKYWAVYSTAVAAISRLLLR